MNFRIAVVLGLAVAAARVTAQEVDNGAVLVSALGSAGAYTGFTLNSSSSEVAVVRFGSSAGCVARKARAAGGVLRFSDLAWAATPTLGPRSFVQVKLLPGSAYPEVSFSLDLQTFDPTVWEQQFGKVPFHFLACSVPGAEVFHQRGWAIGTPVVDDYIQMKAEGPGRTIVSNWSRNWMYAPPIGAYPTAIAGLWHSAGKRYVGYDFHAARLTDHTEKDFGTTYCWKQGEMEQFFCLTWPAAEGYITLRYPTAPAQVGTHFRLLWSQNLGPDDDPNRFVHEFLWKTHAALLPDSEPMNDLSWLPRALRAKDFGTVPGGIGSFVHNTGETGEIWWQPQVNIVGGVPYFSPVDYCYETGDRAAVTRLEAEARRIVGLGKWLDVQGDRCFYWQTPLDGGGAKMFGPGVETFHHVSPMSGAIALLDYYRNDPQGARDLLPVLDGILRYTKHILYTRNCYPDVPAAQFAWSATPITTFCWKYYYRFRHVPERQELAELAAKLARNLTYRYLALWPCDNDEMDDLDSSFMMEPNAGLPWLGSACANEVWVYNIAMLYEYVATGDPIMGHYLRGMLERYHQLYQDQYYAEITQYPNTAFTERFGLYKEAPQAKGTRAEYGGLWGGFERLIWPLGNARLRVVCGEKAALAFCRDGRRATVEGYRCFGNAEFSFGLVPCGLQANPDEALEVTVTFPFFDLRDKEITVRRDGQRTVLTPERIERYASEPATLNLKGLRLGDVVAVGRAANLPDAALAPELDCAIAKTRAAPAADGKTFFDRSGFRLLNLARQATAGISRDWNDPTSYAGFEPGVKTLYGVPFLLLDPDLTQNRVAVAQGSIPYGGKPETVFVLLGGIGKDARLTVERGKRRPTTVDLGTAVPVLKGWPPLYEWHLDLVTIENGGKPVTAIVPTGCTVFAITATDTPNAAMPEAMAALAARREQLRAQRETVAGVAALKPLFEPFKGRFALLPMPGASNPQSNPLMRLLNDAGLRDYVLLLTPDDLVNPQVFNRRNVWVAFYFGGEEYCQTVHREGDGDEALLRWLKAGGTLASLGSGPFPFYYNEKSKPVVNAPKFGLPISGSGANKRLDTLDVAPVTGWEKPPEGLTLTLHVNPDQKVFTSLPRTLPWAADADPRWRPIFNLVDKADVYTPLVTLQDQNGRKYGEAAALIDYRTGDLAGARVLYLWHSLRLRKEYQTQILVDILKYLLKNMLQPIGEVSCPRATTAPTIDGKLDDAVWQEVPATEPFTRFDPDRGDGTTLQTTAKLAWDDRALYVAWECADPDIWSTLRERDGNVWEGEAVELYLDPDGDGKDYYEFEVSPLNTVVDLKIAAAQDGAPQDLEAGRAWNAPDCKTAVNVEGTLDNRADKDTRWTAEAAIPLAAFGGAQRLPPKVGDQWRVQLYRIERAASLPHPQFSAWSATNTFHNPARFGRLTFAANPCHDDFSAYAEGSAPTPTWTLTGGEWKVVSGELVGRNSGTSGFTPTGAVTSGPTWTDYRAQVRFQIRQHGGDHRDGAWIGFRYRDMGACYSLNFGREVQLHKANAGVNSGDTSALAHARWANDGNWHTVAITAQGTHITVELDGAPLLEAEDKGALGVPARLSGGLCLAARRWEGSSGDTVVAFDDVILEKR